MKRFFTGSQQVSADDVRREYEDQIERFMRDYPSRNSSRWPLSSKRTLKDLFAFTRNTCEAKTRLEARAADLNSRLITALSEAATLRDELEKAQKSITDHTTALQQKQQELNSADARWQDILDDANRHHEREVCNIKAEHAIAVGEFQDRIDVLISDMMHNQADSRAWTDEKLKKRLGDLRREVSELSVLERTHELSRRDIAEIDRHGFLARAGMGNLPFLLRSLLWDIMEEHFFSLPLGFGALGPEEGKKALLRIYKSWRAVFDGGKHPGT